MHQLHTLKEPLLIIAAPELEGINNVQIMNPSNSTSLADAMMEKRTTWPASSHVFLLLRAVLYVRLLWSHHHGVCHI